MKTRFSSLVNVKKNAMQKSERAVEEANAALKKARQALEESLLQLQEIQLAQHGQISQFLANRTLVERQRALIRHNEEWVSFANQEIQTAKEQLKLDMIEYEKFNYLELQEIKKVLKLRKIAEAKELDEVALMTYSNNKKKEAS